MLKRVLSSIPRQEPSIPSSSVLRHASCGLSAINQRSSSVGRLPRGRSREAPPPPCGLAAAVSGPHEPSMGARIPRRGVDTCTRLGRPGLAERFLRPEVTTRPPAMSRPALISCAVESDYLALSPDVGPYLAGRAGDVRPTDRAVPAKSRLHGRSGAAASFFDMRPSSPRKNAGLRIISCDACDLPPRPE